VIILSTIVGWLINFFEISPIKALIYAAVINGVIAVPLIFIIALIAKNEKIMGEYKSKKLSIAFVWITFISMAVAAIALLFSL
jgi:Mn2+/Fe2+ NRAMP family transporter